MKKCNSCGKARQTLIKGATLIEQTKNGSMEAKLYMLCGPCFLTVLRLEVPENLPAFLTAEVSE